MVEEDNSQSRSPPRQPPTAEEQSVAKANEAIAIRPKRGRLTLLSRRIYNALLYHSQRQGVDEPVYRLTLSELIGDARFNSNNTELLKSHLRDMQATTIEWSTSSSSLKRWVSSQLLGTVTIEEQGRGRPCMVTWRYPDEIKERLVKPHQYTRVLLEMSSQMRSYSAAVLYEIGARYLTSPGRLSMREDVVWWAAVLTGRSDIKEVDYRFLKRDVISKALAEIDALCEDFGLELIEHKRGRKIEEIQFRVVPKVQQRLGDISASNRNVFDLALVGRLIALGLKQDEAQDLYATTDEGQIRATLDHVDQRLRNASMPVLKSPAAYFKDALKKGYAGVTAMEPAPSSGPAPALAPPAAVLSEADRLRRIRELWENDRMGQARAVFAEMPQPMQAEVRTRFEAERLDQVAAPIARAWRRDGPASRVAATTFFRWLAEDTWPEEPSDRVLLDFALQRGVAGL
ncbi:RepB family plasmid replication initiator protein [Variovorax beijingensis]|uniref:RepB family plasmid replication initiator protein n=1 Tax=Variovorax beijingensis TaxID=2496117 RepID=A0A3P3EMT9_9BURK|nr:replication initiation protein [Variovorax beijingensis]RRH86688.1 RepB family plasmid replication initiator protein [Variovorax beijingensis]RSZ29363.1 RepB family plasmid replication initiator protein [Variovorax beijingensis]